MDPLMLTKTFFWSMAVIASVFLKGHLRLFGCLFFFGTVFLLQENLTDLYYYREAYLSDIYHAETGFNELQIFFKRIPVSNTVSFELLKLTPLVFLVLFLPKNYRVLALVIVCSQFGFLAIFNGLRQGIAAAIFLSGLFLYYREKRIFAIILMVSSSLFHFSSIALCLLLFFLIKPMSKSNVICFAYLFLATFVGSSILGPIIDQLNFYDGYLRASSEDAVESRFNPELKFLVILVYMLIFSGFKFFKDSGVLGTLARFRILLFLIGFFSVFIFEYSELAARVNFYFLALDAAFFAAINFGGLAPMRIKLLFFLGAAFPPSVLTILSLQ